MTETNTTTRYTTVWIPGEPRPQGSKSAFMTKQGRIAMREASKGVKGWRDDVYMALLTADPDVRDQWPYRGGVSVFAEFVLKRPSSAPKRRTPVAAKKPDVEKLTRAVFDAVTAAGVWHDDSQVVQARTDKRIAEVHETPGCWLVVVADPYAWPTPTS